MHILTQTNIQIERHTSFHTDAHMLTFRQMYTHKLITATRRHIQPNLHVYIRIDTRRYIDTIIDLERDADRLLHTDMAIHTRLNCFSPHNSRH